MKKFLIRSLAIFLLYTVFSCCVFEEHFHAILAADYVCPDCGSSNTLEDPVLAPTCTSEGQSYVFCMDCDYSWNVTIPALGHNYAAIGRNDATCTSAGSVEYACSRCGNTRTDRIDPLGHDYSVFVSGEDATCTKAGEYVYKCSRCSDRSYVSIAALGHDYKGKVTKEPTCTEDGVRTFTCSRCGNSYTRKIDMLGHDVEYEEVEPTCTKDGYKKGICKRCHEESSEIYPALGHDLENFVVTKQPTCTEDGERKAVCKRCGEEFAEIIRHPGHKYEKEWTIDKEATYFEEGLEHKDCLICGERFERPIAKMDKTPLVAGGSGVVLAAAGVAWWFLRRKRKLADKAIEEGLERMKPEFEDKTIVFSGDDEQFLKKLKSKSFLAVSDCEKEELVECVKENEPDLVIVEVNDEDGYAELEKLREEELDDQSFAYLCDKKFIKKNKKKLDEMVKEKKLVAYTGKDEKPDVKLVRLVLPVMKPDMKSDEQLGNIGMIADALGIPGISTLIDVYVSGRDIKATLESEEIGVSETATIIADIASILGLDTVASVAGLVDDVDSIKAALDKDAGANERKYGVSGVKDIVEVVSDLKDKG